MFQKRDISVATLAALLTVVAAPKTQANSAKINLLLSQFGSSETVNSDKHLQINSSDSMAPTTATLSQQYQQQNPAAKVKLKLESADAAIKELLDGKTDIAAIGRPLTQTEKNQGLVATPIARRKIAIVVGEGNAFNKSLNINQFAQIFRGEVKDWSKVGGSPGVIRLVDLPDSSDSRQALQKYPVFKKAPFKTGTNAVQVNEESAKAAFAKLGKNGVGYATIDRVRNQPGIRVLAMHDTLPTDPRYPFSQPLYYVYKGPTPKAAVQSYLNFATAPTTQPLIEQVSQSGSTVPVEAKFGEIGFDGPNNKPTDSITATSGTKVDGTNSSAVNNTVTDPSGTGITTKTTKNSGWKIPPWLWWLLPLALLAGLLAWWKSRGGVGALLPVAATDEEARLVLVPRNCRDAYAYWEVSETAKRAIRKQGGKKLKLRLYDVTDVDIERQIPPLVGQWDANEKESDLHLPIERDDRDYIVQLGYTNDDRHWWKLAQSERVRVPSCQPNISLSKNNLSVTAPVNPPIQTKPVVTAPVKQVIGATALPAVAAVGTAIATAREPKTSKSRLVLVPRNCKDVYAYWEIAPQHHQEIKKLGGKQLKLRLYDVTDIDLNKQNPLIFRQFDCSETEPDLHLPIVMDNRDYLAEIGYVTGDGRWLKLSRSASVRVPVCPSVEDLLPKTNSDKVFLDNTALSTPTNGNGKTPTDPTESRIVLTPRNCKDGYVYWEIPESRKRDLKRFGGKKLILRLIEADSLGFDGESPGNIVDEFECQESEQDKHILIPQGDRDYCVELGYSTPSGQWLSLASSAVAKVPPCEPETSVLQTVKTPVLAGITTKAADLASDVRSLFDGDGKEKASKQEVDSLEEKLKNRIILVAREPHAAYVYWEVTPEAKKALKKLGGEQLKLRVYEVTNMDMDTEPAHSIQEFDCQESERDKHIFIPVGDRDYVAELGYSAADGRWLSLARSLHTRIPGQ